MLGVEVVVQIARAPADTATDTDRLGNVSGLGQAPDGRNGYREAFRNLLNGKKWVEVGWAWLAAHVVCSPFDMHDDL